MAWLRNKKTGGWFQVPDEELKKETNQYMNDKIRAKGKTETERIDSLKDAVESATSRKQVLDILNKNKIKYRETEPVEWLIERGDPKTKALDIEMDDGFRRIYYSKYDKQYILQERKKMTLIPNGKKRKVPINEGVYEWIDDYDTKIEKR